MNNPRKKPLKTVRKSALLIACALFAAACAGVLWLIHRPTPVEIEGYDTSVVLSTRTLSEIDRISIQNEEDSFVCAYDGGVLTLESEPGTEIKESSAQKLLNCCQTVRARETVLDTAQTPVALANFGLDSPRKAEIAYQGGEQITLLIGALTPEEIPGHYMILAGDTRIFVVDTDFYDAFGFTRETLRAFEQPALNAELIDEIVLSGDVTLAAKNNGECWDMTAPYPYPMDAQKTETLLQNLENIRLSSYLGEADSLRLSDYGLDAPRVTLAVRQARSYVSATDETGEQVIAEIPETTYTMQVGGMRGETMYYVLFDGGVYTAGMLTTDFLLSLDVKTLLNRNPVSFGEKDLSSLTIDFHDVKTTYDITLVETVLENNALETDEYGNTMYRFLVKKDGAEIDSEQFLAWYARLVGISATGDADMKDNTSEPTMTITLSSPAQTRLIEFIPYDSTHFAYRVNGETLFYTDADIETLFAEKP